MEEILKEFELKGYQYRFKGNAIIFQKEIAHNTTITFKYDTKERLLSPKRLVSINDEGMVLQDKVYIRAGSPGKNGKKNPFSAIEMSGSKIVIKTKLLDINSEKIILGHHGQYLLGTAVSTPFAAEGRNFYPVKDIAV
jgi:hypothetical protein